MTKPLAGEGDQEGKSPPNPENPETFFETLLSVSASLLAAARESRWTDVNRLIKEQEALLKAPPPPLKLASGSQALSPEQQQASQVIQKNWDEVQVLLNNERQNAANKLAIISRLRKIKKTYGAKGPFQPYLHDRRY